MAKDPTAADVAKQIGTITAEAMHLTSSELLELGHAAQLIILERTRAGKDVDGKAFKAYSKPYAKERAKAGYGTQPDLARKGHMLGALKPDVTGPAEVTLHFVAAEEATKAAAHNFGVTSARKTAKAIEKAASKHRKYGDAGAIKKLGRFITGDSRRERDKFESKINRLSEKGIKQLPQREFMDIRQIAEVEVLGEMIGKDIMLRVEKAIKR